MSTSDESCGVKPGAFSWNELITEDTGSAAEFYCKLFGWHAVPFSVEGESPEKSESAYTLFKTKASDVAVAGMARPLHAGVPTHWIPYVVVEDADEALAKASELGAKVLLPVTPVPQVGRIAVLKDPLGATLGLHELPK